MFIMHFVEDTRNNGLSSFKYILSQNNANPGVELPVKVRRAHSHFGTTRADVSAIVFACVCGGMGEHG